MVDDVGTEIHFSTGSTAPGARPEVAMEFGVVVALGAGAVVVSGWLFGAKKGKRTANNTIEPGLMTEYIPIREYSVTCPKCNTRVFSPPTVLCLNCRSQISIRHTREREWKNNPAHDGAPHYDLIEYNHYDFVCPTCLLTDVGPAWPDCPSCHIKLHAFWSKIRFKPDNELKYLK